MRSEYMRSEYTRSDSLSRERQWCVVSTHQPPDTSPPDLPLTHPSVRLYCYISPQLVGFAGLVPSAGDDGCCVTPSWPVGMATLHHLARTFIWPPPSGFGSGLESFSLLAWLQDL